MLRLMRRTPLAFACAAALVAACSKRDRAADSAAVADSAGSAVAASGGADAAALALTDPNIVAFLDGANVADSAAGAVATTKGTSVEVRAFGRTMMRDHHALRVAGQEVARTIDVTPEPPPGGSSAAATAAWRDSLIAMPAGPAWDSAYINHEVAAHEAVFRTAQTAIGAAQHAELRTLIQNAAPNIQAHLGRARQLQATLK